MRRLTSVILELRKRHLVQVGVIYLGVAWGLTEFTDFAVGTYGLSRKLLDVLLLLLVFGFPAAIVLAWNHGERGRQTVTRGELLLLTTLAVLAGIGTFRISTAEEALSARDRDAAPGDLGQGSLAVLPFTNSTGADSLDWLGPGLSDLVTSNLAQYEALSVISPQRLFDLLRDEGRAETEQIPDQFAMDIAERSGARLMARGTILSAGTDLIVDVQLIDVSDGTVVGAERVRGTDVFALADSLALEIGGHVLGEVGLDAPVERSPLALTGDLDAFRRFQSDLRERWRSLDSGDIKGRYQLASRYELMPGRSDERARVLQEIIEIEPSSAPAYFSLAERAVRRGDLDAADSLVARFGELQRDGPVSHMMLGRLYLQAGDYETARAKYAEAIEESGLTPEILEQLARSYLMEDRPEAGRERLESALSDPDPSVSAAARLLIGDTYVWEGQFADGLEQYRLAASEATSSGRDDVAAVATKSALDVEDLLTSQRPGLFNRSLWSLLELGRGPRALDLVEAAEELHLREASRLVPADHLALSYARGRALELIGYRAVALQLYEEVLSHWGDAAAEMPLMVDLPATAAALRAELGERRS